MLNGVGVIVLDQLLPRTIVSHSTLGGTNLHMGVGVGVSLTGSWSVVPLVAGSRAGGEGLPKCCKKNGKSSEIDPHRNGLS